MEHHEDRLGPRAYLGVYITLGLGVFSGATWLFAGLLDAPPLWEERRSTLS